MISDVFIAERHSGIHGERSSPIVMARQRETCNGKTPDDCVRGFFFLRAAFATAIGGLRSPAKRKAGGEGQWFQWRPVGKQNLNALTPNPTPARGRGERKHPPQPPHPQYKFGALNHPQYKFGPINHPQYDFGSPSTRSAMWHMISWALTGAIRGMYDSRR